MHYYVHSICEEHGLIMNVPGTVGVAQINIKVFLTNLELHFVHCHFSLVPNDSPLTDLAEIASPNAKN